MIRHFKGKFAEPILQGRMVPKGFPANLAKVARRKLIMLDSATFLEALNSPPGNRLEALKGDLAGKHSIRIINPSISRCTFLLTRSVWVDSMAG